MEAFSQLVGVANTGVKRIARQIRSKLVLSDSQLISRAKDGDRDAFGELVRRRQDFVFRQALAYLQNEEAAKDATQEVFIKAYQGLAYFKNESECQKPSAFSAWLYRICKNHCLNILRRMKLEVVVDCDMDRINQSDLPQVGRLKKIIAGLRDEYREVIILRYYQDLKYDQIAQILDVPLSTVKIRLFRAKNELKKVFNKDEMR